MMEVGIAMAAMSVVRRLARRQQDDERREEAALDEMCFDGVDGRLDEDRLIGDDLGLDVLGQRGRERGELLLDGVGDGHGVLPRLLGDTSVTAGCPSRPREASQFLLGILGVADVADFDDVGAAQRDGDIVERGRSLTRPMVRTVSSRAPSSTRPPGSSLFCWRSALATSRP